MELADERPGAATLRVTGRGAERVFANEGGGHRVQRVPPNEKRGRVHTSTITVAVMREPQAHELRLDERDLEWSTCRGSGAGGQHRNVTDSAVQLKHVPSGLMVRCESERSQTQNKQTALSILRARLLQAEQTQAANAANSERRSQVGSGMRGDKRRTIRYQDGQVHDHVLDVRVPLRDYLRGDFGAIAGFDSSSR